MGVKQTRETSLKRFAAKEITARSLLEMDE
jgi:hypothetical protein